MTKPPYAPITEFTTVGLGAERGNAMTNFVFKQDSAEAKLLLSSLKQIR